MKQQEGREGNERGNSEHFIEHRDYCMALVFDFQFIIYDSLVSSPLQRQQCFWTALVSLRTHSPS